MKHTTGGATAGYFAHANAYTATLEQKRNGIRKETMDYLKFLEEAAKRTPGQLGTHSVQAMAISDEDVACLVHRWKNFK